MYESLLELSWLWLADFDPDAIRIAAQPLHLDVCWRPGLVVWGGVEVEGVDLHAVVLGQDGRRCVVAMVALVAAMRLLSSDQGAPAEDLSGSIAISSLSPGASSS